MALRADTRPSETTPTPTEREALRATLVARLPRWYSPWAHLAFPSLVGAGLIAAAVMRLHAVSVLDLLFVPFLLVFANVIEWTVHATALHRWLWSLGVLFQRHTPEHHMVFVCDDMAMRSTREFGMVLIPAYGILAIFLGTLPLTALLWLLRPNLALLYVATSMGYVVAYEWLHLAYHLPHPGPISESRLICRLRRHHATHHTPELMQRWNFNVTVPLADWLFGTIYRPGAPRASDIHAA